MRSTATPQNSFVMIQENSLQKIYVFSLLMFTTLGCATSGVEPLSQDALAEMIQEITGNAVVSPDVVEFKHEGVTILCVSDATYDRMRLITAIAQAETVDATQLQVMLIANFHTTLDARYAASDGIVYGAFLHPLSSLTRPQLESAIRQVAALSRNFGSSYSSDELTYGAQSGQRI
jgi:hypothetical protein